MQYVVSGTKYNLSYKELRELYHKYLLYTDEEFRKNLPEILHTACVICYLKESGNESTLSDKGVIHLLVHQLHIPEEPLESLQEAREAFENICKLA